MGIINLDIPNASKEQLDKYMEMFGAIVNSGIMGIKGGKATLHFDATGQFMGTEVNYWSYKRKKEI